MKTYLAVDITIERGKIFLGRMTDTGVSLEEVRVFKSRTVTVMGRMYWDVLDMYENIIEGLREVASRGVQIASIGISTMGYDVCLFGKDGLLLGGALAQMGMGSMTDRGKYFMRMSHGEFYETVGSQALEEGTVFQLDAMRRRGNTALAVVDKVMFIADALVYMLTGARRTELSMASAGCLIDVGAGKLSSDVLLSVGLGVDNFGEVVKPGEIVGVLSSEVQRATGLKEVPVVAVASYNMASAVVGMPARSLNSVFVCSGWKSFVGVESNRAVVNGRMEMMDYGNVLSAGDLVCIGRRFRGTGLIREVRDELGLHGDVVTGSESEGMEGSESVINPEDDVFVRPESVVGAIEVYCERSGQVVPRGGRAILECVRSSLANRYGEVVNLVKEVSGIGGGDVCMVGEGARDIDFCRSVARALKGSVVVGAIEASGVGNVMVQAVAMKEVGDLWEAREKQRRGSGEVRG